MNCRAFRSHIEEVLSNRLSSDEAQTHAVKCPACKKFYRERLALKELMQTLEPIAAPPDFERTLKARLAAGGNSRAPRRFFKPNFIPGTASIALASFFVLTVCAAVLLKEMQNGFASGGSVAQTITAATTTIAETTALGTPDLLRSTSSASARATLPANKRRSDNGSNAINGLAKTITLEASLKKPFVRERKFVFPRSIKESYMPGKAPKMFEATAPQTKSLVFSSSAARVVTRAATTNFIASPDTPKEVNNGLPSIGRVGNFFAATGLETTTLNLQLAARYGVRDGLLVVSVQPQSIAFRAGLRPADVIEALNNQLLSSADGRSPQSFKESGNFTLAVVRGNQRFFIVLPTSATVK